MSATRPPISLSFLRERGVHKRIALVTCVVACAAALYALLAPRWYRSAVTLVPTKSQRSGGGLSSLLGGDVAAVAAGFLEGSAAGADVQRIAAVLQSVAVSDAVIAKFDLKARYDEQYAETVREALWTHCDVKVLQKPGLVQLSCEDKDPAFVQQMLTFFAEVGNVAFRRVGVSSASEEVAFLEKHVLELRRVSDEAANRMREFQEKHRIVDLDTQAKAVVSALASLNSQKIAKQLELEYARTFSGREEPSLRQLEAQLSVMRQKARSLEEPTSLDADPAKPDRAAAQPAGGVFPAALEVPRLRAEYEKLYRDRRVAEATLIFALERLEGARANEAREVSTFLVLDPPTLPMRHSRPRRGAVVVAGLIAGLALAFGREWVRAIGLAPTIRLVLGTDKRAA